MLTPTTQKIIELTLTNKRDELMKELYDLEYHDIITLYTMCLNLSRVLRDAPNFKKPA